MSFVLLSVISCAHLWREGVAARRAPPGTATVPLQRNPPRRLLARSLLGLTLASAPFAVAPGVWADTEPAAPYAGELLALRQTPQLWAVDAAGAALLVADSSALAAHEVGVVPHSEVSLHGLRQMPGGELWLSLPMVKVGDTVYLPQARADGATTVLRPVASIDDLALIGIDAENYGRQILDQATWEARSGLRVADLLIESLVLDGSLNGQVAVGQTAQESSESSAPAEVTAPAELGPPGFRSEGEPSLPPPDRTASGSEWAVA